MPEPTHENPGVSVVIATHDRDRTLARAVRSVWEQNYSGELDLVVVVDDGRDPADVEVPGPDDPARQRLRVVANDRASGVAGARNTGLGLARHDLVATCDDDDVWLPGRLLAQVARLRAEPDLLAVGGSVRVVRGDVHVVRRAPQERVLLQDLLDSRVMELAPSAMLYRRRPLALAGAWDETLPGGYAEDYDLLLRLARTGPLGLVPDVVADIHWNGGSYFFSRWRTNAAALTQLLERFPEYAASPRGRARISGQIAFAHAAVGDRRGARRWMRRAWTDHRREPRVPLTALVLAGVSAGRIQAALQARGRGV
ncbi:glycosyltransferase family 2 protein [Nocardioides zeae]|uniref:Glycosyltransferase family 2 protein n=1 Tax=Nocardioides imazamoxiresistens TaxID=3231893 RepID=A0ABU3PYY8_9ACTN|nr:glycosyltransferase family 2 protein [Nocardioides zeae]MDT9594391.1 glycosyltransferase family 2 protein [Nocardioides zeae]